MVPMRPALSVGVVSVPWVGAAGRGPVGDELQALTIREAIATTTRVRWRRDIDGSSEGTSGRR